MNKELYQLYLEGFAKDYWELLRHDKSAYFKSTRDDEFCEKVNQLESDFYGYDLDPAETYQTKEFQAAKKRWDEIKNSPLYKALE